MSRLRAVSLLVLIATQMALAQQGAASSATQSATKSNESSRSAGTGAITGRLLGDDGQPLADVIVTVFAVSSAPNVHFSKQASTDEDGNFRLADLPPGAYRFSPPYLPGYVPAPDAGSDGGPRYYRIGDSVTLTMVKGGVITGKVTNVMGEPVVAARIRPIQVRDADGHPVKRATFSREWVTDDRGIYRIYSLEPGVYLVAANRHGSPPYSIAVADSDASTYHPAASRSAAAEVTVRSGEEASGIDIHYRYERGRTISGIITREIRPGSGAGGSMTITLSHAASGDIEAWAYPSWESSAESARAFAFSGLSDGEYVLAARCEFSPENRAASPPRRVTVKGADVTGIELTLAPLGSIAGRIVLEPASSSGQGACAGWRRASLREIVITARRIETERWKEQVTSFSSLTGGVIPNNAGDFVLRDLEAGRDRIETQLPGAPWYVRAITVARAAPARQSNQALDAGLSLRPGERLTGLTITLAEGAASLQGRVVADKQSARLPARLRVHLVPTERESADDPLRYTQVNARSDGLFVFTNLAPGRYFLLARPISDDELSNSPTRPVAWDSNERAKLRREAEAAKVSVELLPCQRTSDFTLRYSPSRNQ